MSAQSRLTLVVNDELSAAVDDPVRRVFEHWVFMLGKNPKRCALGPARQRVIRKALEVYDEETLLLAVEGCAASAWHAGENDRDTAYNDIELILRNEAHIERFADKGERLRMRAVSVGRPRREEAPASVDPAEVQAQRLRLRDLAARLRGGGA